MSIFKRKITVEDNAVTSAVSTPKCISHDPLCSLRICVRTVGCSEFSFLNNPQHHRGGLQASYLGAYFICILPRYLGT
ncbi:hypothetical protein ACN38_g10150 [Penicillium nordicum]|uniref:Uncharacterized protein n=1 Tax=Penicillium nordicum TaxID=229535 RepID=A0A0M8NTD8_9EURO|nr:hypothetical protein ACN38_g10150 [Penicillium nordicum]